VANGTRQPSALTMSTDSPYLIRGLAAVAATALLSACASMGDAKSHSKIIEPARLGLTDSAADAASWPAADWWTGFGDPQLTRLIETAQAGNPSIKVAEARVRLAQQAEALARAATGPSVSVNATATRERLSENYIYPPPLGGSTVTDGRVALDFSYEFDFWGKQRAALESALKRAAASQAESDSAKLVLAVSVASTYLHLQRGYDELAIDREELKQREAVVALLKLRIERGLDNRGEIDPQAGSVSSARQELAAAQENIDILKHQLAALTGTGPYTEADLERPSVDADPALALPQSLPADLLGRRPDIIAQRLRIEASAQDIAAARAAFYPNLDLTAFFGVQAIGTSKLFDIGSRTYGVGPALHLPVFNTGSLRADLGAKYAQYDLAVEQYNQTVIDAAHEVADQGTALRSIAVQRQATKESLRSFQKAYDLNLLRYRKGLTNYLTVLNGESALFIQKRVDAQLRERQLQTSVNLIRALGGGYAPSLVASVTSKEAQHGK
jgi:NodT family efflux transporter outer membrane factor (OMF) lipoprotein